MRAAEGFTLLEMMIVLVVISLTLAVGLPAFRRTSGADAATAARQVASALALTRAQAMASRRPASLVFDPATGQFQPPGRPGEILPAGMRLDLSGVAAGAGRSRTAAIVTFFPDGSATGGRLRLAGRGADAVIDVDWLTGAIHRGQ